MDNKKSESNCQDIQKAVVNATKAANQIPLSEFTYYSTFEAFAKVMQHEKRIVDELMGSMVKLQKLDRSFEKKSEVDDKFDILCDVNDLIVDRVGHLLDDALGLKKKNEELVIATLNVSKNIHSLQSTASWNKQVKQKQEGVYNLYSAKVIQRPQSKFKDKIDNRNIPFVPVIKYKPNSIKPLAILAEKNELGEESFSHPYEFEIEKFEIPDCFLEQVAPKEPKPLQETPFHYIDKLEDLKMMCDKLAKVNEIAVDLEHHSYRSFQGFTCLMQISTREEDFIIDTLELRSELYILNEIFTNPKVVKVFHGADMDVVWLQRDFGVYIVNLFDTGQAAKMLNFAHFSLAFLLKHYCNFEANKQFQLADWRMRPLPDDMLQYAREDTHYLLYIYDKMRNELISKGNITNNLLRAVFDRSRQVCLKKYEKPILSEATYLSLIKKSKSTLNNRQLYALQHLCIWRDKIARFEDESLGYVLPNHMILQISEVLPREQQGVLACCNPVPPLVKQQLNEIHAIILKARELPIDKTVESIVVKNHTIRSRRLADFDDHFHWKEDINYETSEASHHLNTLLNDGKGDELDYVKHGGQNQKRIGDQQYKSLVDFFTPLAQSKRKLFIPKPTPKRKNLQVSVEPSPIAKQEERVEKVHSFFMSLSDKKEENVTREEEPREKEQPVVKREPITSEPMIVDEKPLRDFLPKKQKKRKKGRAIPDIPCNSVASAIYKIESGQPSTSAPVASAVKPFDYESVDYNKYSSKKLNTTNKNFFDPISNLKDNINQNSPKIKNKRKNNQWTVTKQRKR